MKNLIFLLFGFIVIGCKAQDKLKLHYVTHNYNETKNKSFINNELVFLKNKDTLRMNIKVPFDSKKAEIIDLGIFYNCHLKPGILYIFELKKICLTDIPEMYNSYYRLNAVFDENDCSKYKELELNTAYEYKGNYGMYIDINNVLYQIIGLSPNEECVFQH